MSNNPLNVNIKFCGITKKHTCACRKQPHVALSCLARLTLSLSILNVPCRSCSVSSVSLSLISLVSLVSFSLTFSRWCHFEKKPKKYAFEKKTMMLQKKKMSEKKKTVGNEKKYTSLRTVFSEFMEDLHSALNARGLTVTILPEKGRSLFTTRNFRPGEEIISQEPYVCVPNNSPVEFRCDRCFASINLKKCSACKVAWYCSSMCQRSEWKLHRLECDALARLDKGRHKSVTPSIRLMIKLFIRRKLQSEKQETKWERWFGLEDFAVEAEQSIILLWIFLAVECR
ncbi:histone-lysine N-methyltransferase ASHR1 isoform X5 [Cucumis melo var. makuwa]|uniref:Histone-lysine N-methyltransferase ASHR1 isoform X5 n=1 Tax=Cucumis melo var. makuwa TaxID=1194695 RepID=A0A5A7TVA9_CUCMM|nr:histone-lysine N-methyltransferase ASHR1 isoform X5 [Cucumis melo var. makuwa]TYK26449.1 histone-lysine N-methyltransferase ASHR1 isoform X5 [Cucumis melo var. makuwa]